MNDYEEFTCPACGFLTFEEPPGSYDICAVCDWEDDYVQLRFPIIGGANRESLCEYQKKWLAAIPLNIKEKTVGFKELTFERDPSWRPLTVEECEPTGREPNTGIDYFESAAEDSPLYYWLK